MYQMFQTFSSKSVWVFNTASRNSKAIFIKQLTSFWVRSKALCLNRYVIHREQSVESSLMQLLKPFRSGGLCCQSV